jgi:hypothetical protein
MASTTHRLPRHSLIGLCALLVLGASLAAGTAARAAPPPAGPDTAALAAERARLRGELDRVNAEIDALKKIWARGVGDEYRLHARMADAEALARRLIDIEARLGLRAPASKPGPLPVAAPTDGPTDLEAKADILADQSRRVRLEADALARRVGELKGRQALRRRAADLERDPFAPLEGSKRRVANIASDTGSHAAAPGPIPVPGTDRPVVPPTGNVSITAGAGPAGASTAVQTGGGTTSMPPPTPLAGTPTTALSLELRDLLDPATVADIRRLEGTKGPTASVQALERAVAALRARADTLDGQARTMRQSARTPR